MLRRKKASYHTKTYKWGNTTAFDWTSIMASPGDAIQVDQATPTPAGPSKPRALSVPLTTPQWLVGYIYSADMLTHFSVRPEGHPEQPARIHKIWEIFVAHDLTRQMKWIPIRQVQEEEALLVHSQDHWYKVLKLRGLALPLYRESS